MTIREKLRKHLVDRGLWPREADMVIATYRDSEASAGQLAHRLDDDTDGYPPETMRILIMPINAEALRWIDANEPQHFARRMFEQLGRDGQDGQAMEWHDAAPH